MINDDIVYMYDTKLISWTLASSVILQTICMRPALYLFKAWVFFYCFIFAQYYFMQEKALSAFCPSVRRSSDYSNITHWSSGLLCGNDGEELMLTTNPSWRSGFCFVSFLSQKKRQNFCFDKNYYLETSHENNSKAVCLHKKQSLTTQRENN